MGRKNFSRRRFVTSVATSSFGLMLFNPLLSFSNEISKLNKSDFHVTDLLSYIDSNGQKRKISTFSEWEIKRKQILKRMQSAMGKLPNLLDHPSLNVQVTEELKGENYIRQTINFTVADNEKAYAYLYIPFQKEKLKRLPAMVALHPTGDLGKGIVDGQGPLPNRAYAKELAQRGYVVIAPDYPGFGDSKDYDFKTDRYQSGTMKSIFDNMRCVDLLQARPDVDANQIGAIGHSLGGHNAMFTGAFDERLKVIVSSSGWTLFDYDNLKEAKDTKFMERYGGRLGDWAQEHYMPLLHEFELNAERNDSDPKEIPFDMHEVIASLAPRGFFSNSPLHDSDFNPEGVRRGIAEASKVYRFLGGGGKIQVRYPDCKHDFPPEVRMEAYQFIDKIFEFTPST